ncbi:LacI family transcriptional regulator [Schleiferilactobacillus harbinensis]|uniref:LacI family DNA-binding transcriptional regulator n=1 Tax=Schleiferilactobacillus harbinensis TaxID=304207 RepID=UPI0021A26148|nr:LacI family DNA-binding transcriptional regulator [Schleiferilactobacillus harbinensis]MCT2908707.1 LacI family transcriptional regulator [Schleiferilactobacillus harbinensis]
MPTIKDIATLAGVSIATVSRVLNNLGGYSEETRKKVMAAAESMNYYRNEMAAGLKKSSAHIIGLIMPTSPTLFYGDIIEGLESEAQKHGYGVIIAHASADGINLSEIISLMAERRVEGLVIASMALVQNVITQINGLPFPVVLVSTKSDKSIPYIKVDDESASFDATEYLIHHGYEKIAIAGPNISDQIAGVPRINGYKRAMQKHHLPVDPDWIFYGTFSFESGIQAMKYYFQLSNRPEAVFSVSDDTAIGIIVTATQEGLQVPKDIAVIGYDNTRVAEMSNPPLTAISQPFFEMGVKAGRKIIDAVESNQPIESEILPHTIVERRSV